MKLYHYDGVWQLPGKQDRKATKVEVSTSSEGLCEFLNDRNVPAFPVFESETVAASSLPVEAFRDLHAGVPGAVVTVSAPTEAVIAAKVSQFKTSEIVEFILDHASVMQVENILASIGTRVGELAKGTRA